jgi:hypothetical protein
LLIDADRFSTVRSSSCGATGQDSVSLADFFWLGIAFNATRTGMAPPVAIAATSLFNLEQ